MVAGDLSGSLQRLAELFQHKDYPAMVHEAAAAVEKWPDAPRCWDLLGVAHLALGQLDQAQFALAKAHALAPNDADILAHWGLTLRTIGRSAEALARLQQAHHLAPAEPSHLSNMGNVCMDLRRYDDAERCFNAALVRQPEYADALNNLGSCLQAQGKMQEALTCYQKALQLDPASPTVLSNIILTSCYQPNVTLKQLKQLAQRYGEAVRPSAATNQMPVLPPLKKPLRRIGFVSGDLHQHPVGYFLESTVAALASRGLELFFYPTDAYLDALSLRLQAHARGWTSVVGLSNAQAALRIRADQLDVLVDLAGHTGSNRLPIFALRAAPLQVSWLGYFGTTGVQEIDAILADGVSVPPNEDAEYTERVVRLKGGRLCFTPPDLDLSVTPDTNTIRPFTFASFSNLAKINEQVIDVWAAILNETPGTHLFVKNKQLGEPAAQSKLRQFFEQRGVDPQRLLLEGLSSRDDYLRAYRQVDVVLDTFPFPGGTTTCEALWMGVPTLTLAGNGLLGRQGASILISAGLTEWVAASLADYREKASVAWRGGTCQLPDRQNLRTTFLSSPLCDAERMATALLDAFETLRNHKEREIS